MSANHSETYGGRPLNGSRLTSAGGTHTQLTHKGTSFPIIYSYVPSAVPIHRHSVSIHTSRSVCARSITERILESDALWNRQKETVWLSFECSNRPTKRNERIGHAPLDFSTDSVLGFCSCCWHKSQRHSLPGRIGFAASPAFYSMYQIVR